MSPFAAVLTAQNGVLTEPTHSTKQNIHIRKSLSNNNSHLGQSLGIRLTIVLSPAPGDNMEDEETGRWGGGGCSTTLGSIGGGSSSRYNNSDAVGLGIRPGSLLCSSALPQPMGGPV